MTPQPWHWLVFGMILILLELVVPSFTIFWFGLGAMTTAGLFWLLPSLTLSLQVFIWAVTSIVYTFLWFRCIKPAMGDKTKAGIALEAVRGETGQVIQAPSGSRRGLVRFATPLLGAEEWQFICRDEVCPGDRVSVTDVSGNTLIVEKK